MKSTSKRKLGKLGESIAADYLGGKGYTILERNWRSPYGEIDLIASLNGELTFVEVKARASKSLGPPEISITPRKEQHLRQCAEYYMQQHPELSMEWCIDLITVQMQADQTLPLIDHFENVIS